MFRHFETIFIPSHQLISPSCIIIKLYVSSYFHIMSELDTSYPISWGRMECCNLIGRPLSYFQTTIYLSFNTFADAIPVQGCRQRVYQESRELELGMTSRAYLPLGLPSLPAWPLLSEDALSTSNHSSSLPTRPSFPLR